MPSFVCQILCSLHVVKLIIPAIPDMLETWTKSFSFKPLEPSHREEVKNLSLVVFAETTLLQKSMHSKGAFANEGSVSASLPSDSYFSSTLSAVKLLLLSDTCLS